MKTITNSWTALATREDMLSPKFPQFFSFCAVQRIDLQGQMSLEQQENVPM